MAAGFDDVDDDGDVALDSIDWDENILFAVVVVVVGPIVLTRNVSNSNQDGRAGIDNADDICYDSAFHSFSQCMCLYPTPCRNGHL